ncbi:MAG: FkbM family methyltransferase [Sulfurimonadaceae bacterium]
MFKKYRYQQQSYSQCGEDLIINFIFNALGIKSPSYVDIGAHHPYYLSNTAFFYEKGCTGICIEPDPNLYEKIKKYRKKDLCLNVGIGIDSEDEADFYIMSSPTLNTFSEEEAIRCTSYGNQKIVKKIKIPLIAINQIIDMHTKTVPNLISLDIEGFDYLVLKSFDFSKYRPEVFCIETLSYTEDNSEVKLNSIIELMLEKDYLLYADTYINTIFVDKDKWNSR